MSHLTDRLHALEDELYYMHGLTIRKAAELEDSLNEREKLLLQAHRDINWLIINEGEDMANQHTPQDFAEFEYEVPYGAVIHIGEEFIQRDLLTGWLRPSVASINIVQVDDIQRWTKVPLSPPPPPTPVDTSPKLPTQAPACITDVSLGLLPDAPLSKWDYGYLNGDSGEWMLFCSEGYGFFTVKAEHILSFKVAYPATLTAATLSQVL